MLHIVSTSPFASQALAQCLARMAAEDGLLLIQDGVYLLTEHQLPPQIAGSSKLFVLSEDMQARGLNCVHPDINVIDYGQFVALTLAYPHTLSW